MSTVHHCQACNQDCTELIEQGAYQVCPDCAVRMQNYIDQCDARHARLQKAADKAYAEYQSNHERGHTMAQAIPFGQPILVGHHSEKRDRRYRERIHNTFDRAFKALQRSRDLQERANHPSRAISSDNPAALIQLRDKLAEREALQDDMKRVNTAIRKTAKIADLRERVTKIAQLANITEQQAARKLTPDWIGRVGYADYELRNNNSEIRRLKGRIQDMEQRQAVRVALEAERGAAQTERSVNDVRIVCDHDDNRVRVYLPHKPSKTQITEIKRRGFHWSPTNGCWQRLLNGSAQYAAEVIAKQFASW